VIEAAKKKKASTDYGRGPALPGGLGTFFSRDRGIAELAFAEAPVAPSALAGEGRVWGRAPGTRGTGSDGDKP
jgi:hypothetical protein